MSEEILSRIVKKARCELVSTSRTRRNRFDCVPATLTRSKRRSQFVRDPGRGALKRRDDACNRELHSRGQKSLTISPEFNLSKGRHQLKKRKTMSPHN